MIKLKIMFEKMWYIVIMFKKPVDSYEHMVSNLIGKYVHTLSMACSAFPTSKQESEKNRMLFYAVADEPFVCRMASPHTKELDKDYTALLIPVSTEEIVNTYRHFMWVLWNRRVPYNSSDTVLCLTHGGGTVTNAMFPDIDVENIQSVFCSQAVVLGLRTALEHNQANLNTSETRLLCAISKCNSRATDPTTLFNILLPFGKAYHMPSVRTAMWSVQNE
jgi:hypothetical protein